MAPKVVVLGAGFGGLELSTLLSDAFTDGLDLTLIDRSDHFVFGYSKLDVMFGRETPDAVRLAYRTIVKPGVRFRQERITAIDPVARHVTTDAGTYEADVLVVALGVNAVAFVLLGLSANVWTLAALLALSGLVTAVWNVVTVTLRQDT